MRVAKKVEIGRAVDAEQRLHATVFGLLGRADRREDRVDAPFVLGGRMQLAVEEFRGGRVGPLALVPEAAHRRGLAAAADVRSANRRRARAYPCAWSKPFS